MIRARGAPALAVFAADPPRLGRWYRRAFEARVLVERLDFVGLDLGGVGLFIERAAPGREPGPGGVRPHLAVPSARLALEELELAGAEVVLPLTDVGEEWIAAFADPEGNVLGLISRK